MTPVIKKYIDALGSSDLLLRLTWDEWLSIEPPYPVHEFTTADATVRYRRNGYDWDMHGTLYSPGNETDPRRAFVFFHGGAGSDFMDATRADFETVCRYHARGGTTSLLATTATAPLPGQAGPADETTCGFSNRDGSLHDLEMQKNQRAGAQPRRRHAKADPGDDQKAVGTPKVARGRWPEARAASHPTHHPPRGRGTVTDEQPVGHSAER